MNKEQAVERFVKDSADILLSKNFTSQRLKQAFGQKYGNQYGKVDSREIAEALILYLKKTGMPAENISKYIDTLPVFRGLSSKLENQLRFIANSSDYAHGLDPEDAEIIKKYEAVEAARLLHQKRIEKEGDKTLEELDRKIQQRRVELASIPSILDEQDIPEPSFDPQFEDTLQWWERFYLKANPFPFGADGLAKIDSSLYEEILVKTKPFQDVLSALNKDPNHLYHTGFLLVGDYGFGKTTFIDYLSHYLIQNNILPIRITPKRSFPDSSGYEDDFHLRLRDELRDEMSRISNEALNDLNLLDTVSQIKSLIRRITDHRRSGVVVFLDDYHKRKSGFKQVFEFLGLQQILKNDLTRAGLNVGFVVSGTPEWERQLSQDGQMRGFLDNSPIVMPNITPQLVCDVFNQRLRAYCYDESARRIRSEFVQNMFKEIEGQAGYRDYLTEIISQLANNNFSIIDTPVDIDQQTLWRLKADLERDEIVRNSFSKLTQTSKFERYTKEQIAKCLALLIQVGMHDGISEADKLFDDNKHYFQLLYKANLIEKRRRGGTGDLNAFDWVMGTRLQKATEDIRNKYKLGVNDYLLKIYGFKGYSSQTTPLDERPSELADLVKFFSREDLSLPASARDNITLALRLFEGNLLAGKESFKPTPEQIDRGWNAFVQLSNAFFEIDDSKKYFHEAGVTDLRNQWRFHWLDDETLSELLHRYEDYDGAARKKNISGSLVLKQLKEVFPALAERLKTITEDLTDNTFGGLVSRNVRHTKEEIRLFEQVCEGYASAVNRSHYEYVKEVTNYIELRLRSFLYATSVLTFGESYHEQMPPALHKYAHKNLSSRPNNALSNNVYSGLTRGQLREIFSQGSAIKEYICKYLDCGWNSADWGGFFDQFAVENITSSHQLVEKFTHIDKPRYLHYCRRAGELMCAINDLIRGMVKNNAYLICCGEDPKQIGDYFFKFIFKPSSQMREEVKSKVLPSNNLPNLLKDDVVEEGVLRPEAYRSVLNSLKDKIDNSPRKSLVEDLLEIEYIMNNYNVGYAEFIQSLAYAYHVDKQIMIQPWFGSSVLIRQASQLFRRT
jgi:hypothetical protein